MSVTRVSDVARPPAYGSKRSSPSCIHARASTLANRMKATTAVVVAFILLESALQSLS